MKKRLTIFFGAMVLVSTLFAATYNNTVYDAATKIVSVSGLIFSNIVAKATLTVQGSTTTGDLTATNFVRIGNGTAAAPSFSFSGDPDTGFFDSAANLLGVAVGGTERWDFSTSSFVPTIDNTYDIGNGATNPRDVNASRKFLGPLGQFGSVTVNDDAYDATTWNGSTNVPTKNAIRDKLEASSGVTAASYGDGTHVGQFTVNAQGVITAASSVAISGGGGGAPTGTVVNDGTVSVVGGLMTHKDTASTNETPSTVTAIGSALVAGTVNKVTITQPATAATLTIANNKTATVSNTLTFSGTDGSSVAFGTGGTAAYHTDITTSIGITIDGGGSAITTGSKGYFPIAYSGTISSATLIADQSGSIVIEVRKCTYAQFDAGATHPVTGDKINSATPPTISSATKSQDTTLTSWTTAVTAGDIFEYVVNSATTITRATLVLKITR